MNRTGSCCTKNNALIIQPIIKAKFKVHTFKQGSDKAWGAFGSWMGLVVPTAIGRLCWIPGRLGRQSNDFNKYIFLNEPIHCLKGNKLTILFRRVSLSCITLGERLDSCFSVRKTTAKIRKTTRLTVGDPRLCFGCNNRFFDNRLRNDGQKVWHLLL